jgi:DNA-binding NarL/FixJ family response regulator
VEHKTEQASDPLCGQPLTEREQQVWDLIKQAYTAKQIGKVLSISHRTVEVHKYRIQKKLGMTWREAVRQA